MRGRVVAFPVSAVGALIDLATPTVCAGCGEVGHGLCPLCRLRFVRATALPRIVAGRAAGWGGGAQGITVAAGAYTGVVRRAVVAYKDQERRDLIGVLAPALRASVLAATAVLAPPGAFGDVVSVVPVPSSSASRRRRGDVPTHDLAREALVGVPVLAGRDCLWAPVLRHTRRVADQSGLGRAARSANMRGAIRARDGAAELRGTTVLLVDDVLTTGATVAECVRALGAAGVTTAGVAVLAATPREETGSRMRPTRRVDVPGSFPIHPVVDYRSP